MACVVTESRDSQHLLKPVLLVLDDDDAIQNLVQAACTRTGWDVWLVDNGREAIRLLRDQPPAKAVVITERPVPEAQRPNLLPMLQRLMPEARCCFVTGETAGKRFTDGLAFVLAKPHDLAELSRSCAAPARPALRPFTGSGNNRGDGWLRSRR